MSNKRTADLVKRIMKNCFEDCEFIIVNELLTRQAYTYEKDLAESLLMPLKFVKDRLLTMEKKYPFITYEEKRFQIARKEGDTREYKRQKFEKRKYYAINNRNFLNFLTLKVSLLPFKE